MTKACAAKENGMKTCYFHEEKIAPCQFTAIQKGRGIVRYYCIDCCAIYEDVRIKHRAPFSVIYEPDGFNVD